MTCAPLAVLTSDPEYIQYQCASSQYPQRACANHDMQYTVQYTVQLQSQGAKEEVDSYSSNSSISTQDHCIQYSYNSSSSICTLRTVTELSNLSTYATDTEGSVRTVQHSVSVAYVLRLLSSVTQLQFEWS